MPKRRSLISGSAEICTAVSHRFWNYSRLAWSKAPAQARNRLRRRQYSPRWKIAGSLRRVISVGLAAVGLDVSTAGARTDDAYLAGYATAVLEHTLRLEARSVTVKHGVITVSASDLDGTQRRTLIKALTGITGVKNVELVEHTIALDETVSAATGNNRPPLAGAGSPPAGIFPYGRIFNPLLADPRWPHFAASYHAYIDNPSGADIATVSFGETIPFYRGNIGQGPLSGQWEAGLQAGVFSDFDLNASSHDLINADYLGGLYTSLRRGRWSAFARVFHQSSHLGDEFLLRTQLQRVNLSYEGADLKLSYEFPFGLRIYGGGGGLFDRDPAQLKPWSTQYGVEFRSPWQSVFGAMRPVFAADFKNFEEHHWNTDVSVRAGVQLDNLHVLDRNLQIMIEYFNGHSPSGQFYAQKIEYVGLGAHFHF